MAANKDEKVPDIVTNAVLVQSEQMPENSEICKGKNETFQCPSPAKRPP